jgi:hypothetical protein
VERRIPTIFPKSAAFGFRVRLSTPHRLPPTEATQQLVQLVTAGPGSAEAFASSELQIPDLQLAILLRRAAAHTPLFCRRTPSRDLENVVLRHVVEVKYRTDVPSKFGAMSTTYRRLVRSKDSLLRCLPVGAWFRLAPSCPNFWTTWGVSSLLGPSILTVS